MKQKLIITAIFIVLCAQQSAYCQNNFYGTLFSHLCTPSNSFAQFTTLDTSKISNVANKTLLVQHVYGKDNTSEVGVYHDVSSGYYTLFNQKTQDTFQTNDYFFVTEPLLNGTAFQFVAPANTTVSTVYLDNPLLNNKPNAKFFITKNWDGTGVYDTTHVGLYYDGNPGVNKWSLYNENEGNGGIFVSNSKYNIFVPNASSNVFEYITTNDSNVAIIDHPLLNNNIDAKIFVRHVYKAPNDYINAPVSVWYTGTHWSIYRDDNLVIPKNTAFNVLIANREAYPTLVAENNMTPAIKLFPNPSKGDINILSDSKIIIEHVKIFDASGKFVIQKDFKSNEQYTIATKNLLPGIYFVKIKTAHGIVEQTLQIQ